MYKRIVVMCPANFASGGPELLHQLCSSLREKKYNALMCYYGFDKYHENPVDIKYQYYNNPYIVLEDYMEEATDIIVLPEVYVKYLFMSEHVARIALWWLSVDNFYTSTPCIIPRMLRKIGCNKPFVWKLFNRTKDKINAIKRERNIIFLVQSQYAYEYCKQKFSLKDNEINYLSDYLNPVFIENAKKSNLEKNNVVLYNPKKGIDFTVGLINYAKKQGVDIKWFPLVNLSREEMSKKLLSSKVYIDFGEHPGKDRIPREAAISGCCVITGKKGSAKYYKDVPIPEQYKFHDDKNNYSKIIEIIVSVFHDYENRINDFYNYRTIIENEYDKFKDDIDKVFSVLCEKNTEI